MAKGLSRRAYGRHRGVSEKAVRKALAAGRITAGPDGTIDQALADRQWAASTDLSKPRNSVNGAPKLHRTPGAPSSPMGLEGPATTEGDAHGAAEAGNGANAGDAGRLVASYAGSRAAREGYAARLAKLDFEQRSGKLVDADEVRAQFYALGHRARETMLGVPDRLSAVLEGQNRAEIHRLLTEEITRGLSELKGAPPIQAGARGQR